MDTLLYAVAFISFSVMLVNLLRFVFWLHRINLVAVIILMVVFIASILMLVLLEELNVRPHIYPIPNTNELAHYLRKKLDFSIRLF